MPFASQSVLNQGANQPLIHRHVAVSPSTNSELMQQLANGDIDKTRPYLLTASMQTAGRGQRTRTWQSPIGNIYLSLYHPLQSSLSGLLSLVVGLHITRLPVLQNLNRQRRSLGLPIVGVKWANDIGYYDTESLSAGETPTAADKSNTSFHKLAGILIEPVVTDNKITGVIIGVGMNIEAAPVLSDSTKEGMDYQAISLTQIIKQTQNYKQTHIANKDNAHSAHNSLPSDAHGHLPRAEDLYIPVSATLLRAVAQFEQFSQQSYALTQFIEDYSAVNVLAGRPIIIEQPPLSAHTTQATKLQSAQDKHSDTVVIHGVVTGINTDGSLAINTTQQGYVEPRNIYTGTIRLTGKDKG